MAASMLNIFAGSETGLLKAIDVNRTNWSNLNSVQSADRKNEILALCWNDKHQNKLSYGLRNREIHTCDIENNEISSEKLDLVGGSGLLQGLARVSDNYITAVSSGLVKIWNKYTTVTQFEAGDKLCCMTQQQENENIIATGGDENDLKVWDLQNHNEPIFVAKNVRNDWLNLRVPIKVQGIQFVPKSHEIVTCTGYHQVRLYDPRTKQRRPVVDMKFDEYPIMSMGLCHTQTDQVIVGNTQGKTALLDFRKGKVVHKFKGFAGSVRSIECHPSLPFVVTCGLDRFVRIHHIQTREVMHKFYLKSRLNCLLLSKNWTMDSADEGIDMKEDEEDDEEVKDDANKEDEDIDDDIWDKLEIVSTNKTKKIEDEQRESDSVVRHGKQLISKRTVQDETFKEQSVKRASKKKKK